MTFRSRALLDIAHDAPCCMKLGVPGCGEYPSVPAHSDMIRHGRGEGHKSHDCFAVACCPACHDRFKRSVLGREGYLEAWTAAMERYILWLWVSERIKVVTKRDTQKEPSMEAPMCRICEHRHWAREPHQLPPDAPAEKRSTRTPAPVGEAPKGGERRPGRSGDCSSSRLTAQAGETPAKNTSREGRDVLKAKATSTDREHLEAQPATATPGKPAGRQGPAAKPAPGKRKTAPKANRKRVKKP